MRWRYLRSLLALAAILAVGLPASAAAKTFVASPGTLGAIPDGLSGNCASPTPGSPKIVTFAVKGLKDTITSVKVRLTFGSHPWAADITAVLIAPNSSSQTLFGRTGSLTTSQCGDSSDLAGPYTFSDTATLSWWPGASAVNGSTTIPAGVYRTSAAGGPSVSSAPSDTSLTSAFASANPNGTWFVALNDSIAGDAGSVSAAALFVTAKDTIDPNTSIVKKPKKTTTSRTATFRFRSSEAGLRFRCRLGMRPWRDCKRTTAYRVGLGKHMLRVRAIDQAGNRDETPASYSWTVVAG
jgi:hypothetical protein